MVNWQEGGKTWPLPHSHGVRLLRGLVWGQHYRHSNPQREGSMPEGSSSARIWAPTACRQWKTGCGWKDTPIASATSAGGSGPAETGPAKGCAPTGLMRTRTPGVPIGRYDQRLHVGHDRN